MFGNSLQELVMLMVIIGALSMSGFWPRIIRGLRELRGDVLPEEPQSQAVVGDLDVCYRMLGLSPSAPWEDVEKAYRRKAKIHHPDVGGDADAMRALNEAYDKLKRARRR